MGEEGKRETEAAGFSTAEAAFSPKGGSSDVQGQSSGTEIPPSQNMQGATPGFHGSGLGYLGSSCPALPSRFSQRKSRRLRGRLWPLQVTLVSPVCPLGFVHAPALCYSRMLLGHSSDDTLITLTLVSLGVLQVALSPSVVLLLQLMRWTGQVFSRLHLKMRKWRNKAVKNHTQALAVSRWLAVDFSVSSGFTADPKSNPDCSRD